MVRHERIGEVATSGRYARLSSSFARLLSVALVASLLVVTGCSRGQKQSAAAPAGKAAPKVSGGGIAAEVITVRTVVFPRKTAFRHQVVFADGRCRTGAELDRWRLIDFKAKTVTHVDDIAKTFRTVSFEAVRSGRKASLARALPPGVPRARLVPAGKGQTINGRACQSVVIAVGRYRRELCISKELAVPDDYLKIMLDSEPTGGSFDGVLASVYGELTPSGGFPILDRSEMPFDGQQYLVDKRVEKVESRSIPKEWITIPAGYTDLTPRPKAPDARRRRGASPPAGRSAPAAE